MHRRVRAYMCTTCTQSAQASETLSANTHRPKHIKFIPEQMLEQVCQDVHAVAAQSTGQNCVAHDERSEVSPHSCPPFIGC
jgi:hypothetical protein